MVSPDSKKYYQKYCMNDKKIPDHGVEKATGYSRQQTTPILKSYYKSNNIIKTDAQIKSIFNN